MNKILTGLVLIGFFSGLAYSDPTQNPVIDRPFSPAVTAVPSTPNTINVVNDTNGIIEGNGVNSNGTGNNPAEMHKAAGSNLPSTR